MDLALVDNELMEYSKELFCAFRFLSSILWASFLKLKRTVESENWYGHGRTGRISCAGPVSAINVIS